MGEVTAATAELQSQWAKRTNGKPGDWTSQIQRHLCGEIPESQFLAAAKHSDPKVEAGQICEAYFFAGYKILIEGDRAKSVDFFQKAVATGKTNFFEYQSAAAELKRLKTN